MIDGEYIWKYTHNAYDFSVLGNTPITFPIEWASSKIPGYAIRGQRAELPRPHRFRRLLVSGGAFLRAAGESASDYADLRRRSQLYSASITMSSSTKPLTCNISRAKKVPWIGFNWRYDSGMVAGPVPCAGGNCANGPNGSGLELSTFPASRPINNSRRASIAAASMPRPLTAISPTGLCPASQYGSTLSSNPGARHGKRRPQSAPHRVPQPVRSRPSVTTISSDGDRYKWSARLSALSI